MKPEIVIREVAAKSELEQSAQVIRDSFITVANELNLTKENSPTNPAFLEVASLLSLQEKGVVFYGLFLDLAQIGFVAIEKASDGVYYLEKLAVLPEYRHCGYGRELLDFAFKQVQKKNGRKVSIALIDENTRLKNWYQEYGFKETGKKLFPHLPFTVCFMEKEIEYFQE